jgi:TPP-dependent pyruvate/acetoin dehydrogenase alpha subunit
MDKEKMLGMFRKMIEIRLFEETVSFINRSTSDLFGQVMTSEGMEGVVTGVCANLRNDDYAFGTHRSNGQLLAKGGDLKKMMAEIYAKATGYCGGRGGQMHYQALDVGFITSSGVVGDGLVVGPGSGLSIKLRGTDQVAVVFFAEGASNTGSFHEGVNLAAIWKLPVIFVCDNNQYAVSTHVSRTTPVENIADRACGYGIPGVVVDGMDVLAVYDAAHKAVERARKGQGPSLLECKTYRFSGQSALDPGMGIMYRTKEEMESWRKKDPVKRYKEQLIEMKVLTEAKAKVIEDEVRAEIDAAVKFARESPEPDVATLWDHL